MKNLTIKQPVLFLLEDNAHLTNQVTRLAARMGFQVFSARSLKEATALFEKRRSEIDALMIDLMVPQDAEDLTLVDKLLTKREAASKIITSRTSTDDEKKEADSHIDGIDAGIQKLILDDGGIQFLRTDGLGKTLDNRVVVAIFTARRGDVIANPAEGKETVKAAVNSAMGRDPNNWFEKPIPPDDLEIWLEDIKGRIFTNAANSFES
jgi:CheY-like chemotaxis protein